MRTTRAVEHREPQSRGVRVSVLFGITALVVLVVAVAAGFRAADRTGEVARTQARRDAWIVARRAAAVVDAAIERGAAVLDTALDASGVDEVTGPDAAADCSRLFAPLNVQGFSLEMQEPDGTPVCLAPTTLDGGRDGAEAGRVRAWLRSRTDWDRLGPLYEPPVPARMTLAPDGLLGTIAVALPTASGRTVTSWIDASVGLAGVMAYALAAPGVATAVVVDDEGRVAVPAARLRSGQPKDSQARPGPDGRPVAEPLGRNALHERVSRLDAGVHTAVRPSSRARGGPASSDGAGDWVTAPVPRLDAHVAVAYDPAGPAEVRAAARRNGLLAALAVGATALGVLVVLWALISRPLERLAASVRRAERTGRRFVPPGGHAPREVRSLAAALVDFAGARDQLGEVATAARERERARVVERLNGEVAQSLAAASLVVRTDPEAAAGHLRVASSRLARATAELDPAPLPAGGVGAVLAETAGSRLGVEVEDRTGGRRLDPVFERLLLRSTLEVLDAVDDAGDAGGEPPRVRVTVGDGERALEVAVEVTGGGPCPALDDPGFHQPHEFTASGGSVRRSARDGVRRIVLRAG